MSSIYSIKQNRDSNDTDKLIEKLRSERIAEERLKNERQAKELQKNVPQLMKAYSSKVSGTPSYDISGKAVNIKRLNAFPDLIKKCKNRVAIIHGSSEKAEEIEREEFVPSSAPITATSNPAVRIESRKPIEKPKDACALYEAIVPAVGVTFLEAGKHPKANIASISQKTGKMSKNEFNTLMTSDYIMSSMITVPKTATSIIQETATIQENRRTPVPSATKIVFASQSKQLPAKALLNSPVKISITGDMSQLLVSKNDQVYSVQQSTTSVMPQSYVPPMYRSQKSLDLAAGRIVGSQKAEAEMEEMLNSSGTSSLISSGGKIVQKPIEKEHKRRGPKKPFRERNSNQSKARLPPPPIGESTGHGIIQL